MNDIPPWMPLAVLLSGLLAGAVLWGLTRLPWPARHAPNVRTRQPASTFLVRDGRLVDHDAGPGFGIATWSGLKDWFDPRFDNLPATLPDPGKGEALHFPAREGDASIEIGAVAGGYRITLRDPHPVSPADKHDTQLRLAGKRGFRDAMESVPVAVCAVDDDSTILWRNSRFAAFTEDEAARLVAAVTAPGGCTAPVALPDPITGHDRQFELTLARHDDRRFLYAVDITRQVEAETMRGSFIQTLTKTFADLATGLAVFDRDRRLVLFNPALMDLTGLPVAFLSCRPALPDFFDRLRDRQVLPEPKNYASWRAQINEMIETAAGGHYAESWCLPNGLTYRITGRPHPDGAIAFLIEDITDEIALSRRSRTQIEIRQAVLDRLDAAVAVTGPDGLVMLCNRGCREMLGVDPDSSFAETGFDNLVRLCRARFPDPAFWASAAAGRQRLQARLRDSSGAQVMARYEPLPRGFSLLVLSACARTERLTA